MTLKKTLKSALLGLALAYGGYSSEPSISELRDLHRHVWQNGGVCRHAASAVDQVAEEGGLESLVAYLRTDDVNVTHVIPVVYKDNKWHAIESGEIDGRYWASRSRQSEEFPTNPEWYEGILNDNRQLPEYINTMEGMWNSDQIMGWWKEELDNIYPTWREEHGNK